MKKLFLLIFAVLLVLGSALPLAAYRVTRAVLGHTAPLPAASSVPELPTSQPKDLPSADAETFPVEDQSAGKVVQLSRREYVLGAVAAEMPVSWPDEALKAQAVAAHTYALYCRDHAALQSGAWLTVDPARRQGCLTEPVLRSYWGTAYEQNYARLSALVDEVLNDLLFYDNAPACTSYFAISNGRTEASENVWGTALPYLIPVDSGTDLSADNYQYTAVFSAAQVQQAFPTLASRPISPHRKAGSARSNRPPPVTQNRSPSADRPFPAQPCVRHWVCAAPALPCSTRVETSALPPGVTATAWA